MEDGVRMKEGRLTAWTVFCLVMLWNIAQTSSFCPASCSCDNVALSVKCHGDGAKLRVVPIFLNPQIRSLVLANNQIKDITLSLQFYSELELLDISTNQLESLGSKNFEGLIDLVTLNGSTNGISSLKSFVFKGLRSLQTLDLGGNMIALIEPHSFNDLESLEDLNLSKNRLELVDWSLFTNLSSLTRLKMSYNFIQSLQPSIPPNTLLSMTYLDLSFNQIAKIEDRSLASFPNLVQLNLANNYIHTIGPMGFYNLEKLEHLNLNENKLSSVPSISLRQLNVSLQYLDLSSNVITGEVKQNDFDALRVLIILKLSGNTELSSFHSNCLRRNTALQYIEADHLAALTSLPPKLLENKPYLHTFSVQYAQITSLDDDFFVLTNVNPNVLQITGNPLDCNCSAFMMYNYIQKIRRPASVDSSDHSEGTPMSVGEAQYDSSSDESLLVSVEHGLDPLFHSSQLSFHNTMKLSESAQCHHPNHLAGLHLKDVRKQEFKTCSPPFNGGLDSFQILVICIAGTIVAIICVILCIKLCCVSGICDFLRRPKKAPQSASSVVTGLSSNPEDKLFDPLTMLKKGRDIPSPPAHHSHPFHPQVADSPMNNVSGIHLYTNSLMMDTVVPTNNGGNYAFNAKSNMYEPTEPMKSSPPLYSEPFSDNFYYTSPAPPTGLGTSLTQQRGSVSSCNKLFTQPIPNGLVVPFHPHRTLNSNPTKRVNKAYRDATISSHRGSKGQGMLCPSPELPDRAPVMVHYDYASDSRFPSLSVHRSKQMSSVLV